MTVASDTVAHNDMEEWASHPEQLVWGLVSLSKGTHLLNVILTVPDSTAGPEAFRLDRRDVEVIHEYADAVYGGDACGGLVRRERFALARGSRHHQSKPDHCHCFSERLG